MKKQVINTYKLSLEENFQLIPNFFYKYCKVTKSLKENIKNNQLWFNSPVNFNDPFDCKAYLNFGRTEKKCKENFDKFNKAFKINHPPLHLRVWKRLLKRPNDFNLMNSYSAARNFEDWLGVTCFSENDNNPVMWSHYADSHKGIILEFNKGEGGFLTKNLLPVRYFKNYPIINVSDYAEEQMISIVYQTICAKGIGWKFEKEWRAITVPGKTHHKFNRNELSGVIFGLNTRVKTKHEIYDLVNSAGYLDVKFKQAEFEERKLIVRYVEYKL